MTTSEKKMVTIEKWYGDSKSWFWIVDENGNGIDGFSKKWQAIDAIERWDLVRKNTTVKERK